eukprot:CAMPEP_0185254746 /NCGR_PEP_ID=MMETSP1359-20130426/3668_1 /TAXON_ID=552665 /ORGANISM="Bigelowiella longifila, Strain CCMP242" /LENGTH=383 /DNA_ID=CAMNT_0027838081 /DNA_START=141 /DNA_END=1292 /DNA_ORIENTATION=-
MKRKPSSSSSAVSPSTTTTGRESKGSGMETGDDGLFTESDKPKVRRRREDNVINGPSSFLLDRKSTTTSRTENEGNREGARWENRGEENDSLNDLLQTFAKMVIPKSDHEYCPLCFNQFKIGEEFSNHVHKCLDKMETNLKQRDDGRGASMFDDDDNKNAPKSSDDVAYFPGGDCPNGIKCTITTAEHFRFCRHPKVECPICCEKWHMHEINAHINFCLNKGGDGDSEVEMKKASPEISSSSSSGGSDVKPPPPPPSMSTQQMAACAKAILDAKEKEGGGDDSLVNMLQRFKTLGFTRENLKSRLKEINKSGGAGVSAPSSSSSQSSSFPEQQQGSIVAPATSFALKPPSFTFNANSFTTDEGMKKEEKKETTAVTKNNNDSN